MLMSFVVWRCDVFFFFKQKTAYELRISDWSSDVCSSDLIHAAAEQCGALLHPAAARRGAPLRDRRAPAEARQGDGQFAARRGAGHRPDRKSVVSGQSVSVRVDLGGRSIIKKKNDVHKVT